MRRLRQEEEKRQVLLSQRLDGGVGRYPRIFMILVILAVGVVILEIWMMNRLATYGNKIYELKTVRNNLELENQVLENQISQTTSLISLEEKAKIIGFDSIKSVEYPTTFSDLASAK